MQIEVKAFTLSGLPTYFLPFLLLLRNPCILQIIHTLLFKESQPKCLPTAEWLNPMLSVPTTEYYSAIKGGEAQTQATVWVNLGNLVLRERSQTQKATYCMIPFM